MRYLVLFLLLITSVSQAQVEVNEIVKDVTQEQVETHIRFLASDELLGRETGTPGIDIAAAYISSYFKAVGVKHAPGMDSYYQTISFYNITPAEIGNIQVGNHNFDLQSGMVSEYVSPVKLNAPVVFVENSQKPFMDNIGGKVVLLPVDNGSGDYRQAIAPGNIAQQLEKYKSAGAKAVIYLWNVNSLPWSRLHGYLGRKSIETQKPDQEVLPHFFVDASNAETFNALKELKNNTAVIDYAGRTVNEVKSHNVIGYIEGKNPSAKEEILLLSAHYDHVGGKWSDNGEDLIYNGARDNAVGTAAIMMAADYFAEHKPERSVLIAAWTAEEKGLMGSRYFVENSPVDLKKIIYNLNIDNAGYNDTTIVTVVGLDRTLAGEAIKKAASAYNLKAVSDPAPEQNLFDRSDNVNFAQIGIPAPTFSLGFTAFDDEIIKYYHNVADEAEGINYNYVTRYTRAYVLAAEKIANKKTETFWKEGDKYEPAGKSLYNK